MPATYFRTLRLLSLDVLYYVQSPLLMSLANENRNEMTTVKQRTVESLVFWNLSLIINPIHISLATVPKWCFIGIKID